MMIFALGILSGESPGWGSGLLEGPGEMTLIKHPGHLSCMNLGLRAYRMVRVKHRDSRRRSAAQALARPDVGLKPRQERIAAMRLSVRRGKHRGGGVSALGYRSNQKRLTLLIQQFSVSKKGEPWGAWRKASLSETYATVPTPACNGARSLGPGNAKTGRRKPGHQTAGSNPAAPTPLSV